MIRCVVFRGSSAAAWLTAARRFNSKSASVLSNETESSSLQGTTPEPTSSTLSSNKDHVTRYSPSPRPPLPISPLMDPSFLSARQKHSTPKASPDKNTQTPFQQQLAKNPYALALATPVRMCNLTREVLPRYFLQDYELLAHPETGVPWWMPRSLTTKYERKEKPGTGERNEGLLERKDDVLMGEEAVGAINSLTGEANTKPKEVNQNRPIKLHTQSIGPSAYTLARKDLLHALQNRKSGYGEAHSRLGPPRMRERKASKQLIERAQWRPDMDDFILELMRRRAIEVLIHVTGVQRGYVIGCKSWEDALAKHQVGAYLWTGGSVVENSGQDGAAENPPEFATLNLGSVKQQKVPVHNLPRLLGREKLEELRRKFKNGIFNNNVLAVKHKKMTVGLQLKLWKLQGYLAEHREASEVEVQ